MYMVIHDPKHPTESLISSVEKIRTKFTGVARRIKKLNVCQLLRKERVQKSMINQT